MSPLRLSGADGRTQVPAVSGTCNVMNKKARTADKGGIPGW